MSARIGAVVCWLCGLGVVYLALVKPVHMDDPVVLHVAENILSNPLRPFVGDYFWLAEPGALRQVTTNPPLVSYWLAPWIGLFGYREWLLHLSLMPFVALLGWGVYRLAERWLGDGWGWWAVGWVMLSPAVLPGLNLMRDVPMLGLFVGGMACWVEGLARHERRWLILGALLGGLSALAKYTALIWLPIALVYTLLGGPRSLRAVGWLMVALVPMGLWSLQNYLVEGEVHLLYLWQERRGSAPWETRLLPGITGIGAITLLSAGVLWSVLQRRGAHLTVPSSAGRVRWLLPIWLAPLPIA
ncbi:MAG: glycosyltransferase family 39 protein, partial [Fimbriimonadales bacterium]